MTDRAEDFYTRTIHYTQKRDTWQTPWQTALAEHAGRIGQPFEIVGVNVSDDLMADGGGGPTFDIRFADGFVMTDCDELEVWANSGWEPSQGPMDGI